MQSYNFENPIRIEYYPHLSCDCYKIDLPFTTYGRYTIVLCPVSEGIEKANKLALEKIEETLKLAFSNPIQ